MYQFLIPTAHALEQRFMVINTGIRVSFGQVLSNAVNFFTGSIAIVCVTIFLLGAGYWVAAAGKQELIDTGKKHMLGALQGLAVTLGAYAIVRTAFFLLY
jgi:hypothetical protein